MATAIADYSFKDGHGCPICLDGFTSPRQLPCLHSFCEHCLQDYITRKAKCFEKTFGEFMCPVCRAVTMPANKGKPVVEWASLFPNSPFPVVEKSKVERSCEVCLNASDSSKNVAKKFCVVCDEFMCNNCAISHKSMKMSKNHQILTMDELENNPEIRIRFSGCFGCPEHDNEDIKFYCRSHETACCGTCSFLHHKACSDVLDLKEDLLHLLKEMNTKKIMKQMRKLEDHLKNFMEMNEENTGILESRVNSISKEIAYIRSKLNILLDDIEKMVKLEANRIYKDWLIRTQEQNYQCQSLVSAIRNSQALLETVDQFGSDKQKLLVTNKTMKQLQSYSDQIGENFERVDSIRLILELDSNIKAVLSKDAGGLVKIERQEESKDLQCLMMPLEKRNVELARIIDVHCPSKAKHSYVGVVLLPDGYIFLADSNNRTCCLYDSSYIFITSHILPGDPHSICLMEDNEVAVTMPDKKNIQFMSVRDHYIRDMVTLATKYTCYGIDAISTNEIIISGPCNDTYSQKCYWSVITRNGNVKIHHEFDCQGTLYAYAALDMYKSRVYISVSGGHAVYCFGLKDAKQYFVYLSSDLKSPRGVAVDRDDNVYVLGHDSNNIHKLSPDGVTLQVISSDVPQKPRGISFNYNRDNFVITNRGQMCRKLHYFVHK